MKRTASSPLSSLLLFIAVALAVQLYAFHWGVVTPDTVVQYGQALTGHYEDWHPPVTAWLWRQLLFFHRGSAPFLILDCLLYWTGLGLLADAFRRKGNIRAGGAVLLIGVLPIPFGQLGAILKDALLAASLVCATGIVGRALILRGSLPLWQLPLVMALLVLAAATRFNAAFAAAPLLLLCVRPKLWSGSRPRLGLALVLAGLAMGLSATLINRVALAPKKTQPFVSLVNFDLAGISVASGVSAYPPLAGVPSQAELKSCYEPGMYNRHDTDPCNKVGDAIFDHVRAGRVTAMHAWLGAIAAHPLAYAQHRLRHLNANLRWLQRRVPDDAFYLMSQPNDLGLHYRETWLARRIWHAAVWMASSPLGRPMTWLAVALGVLIASPAYTRPALPRALAVSALLYGLAYALVSVAPDLRYNLWTMLAGMLSLVVAAAEAKRLSGAQLVAASVPVAIVVAAELVVLI